MVPHDSESTIQATSCLDPGCYFRFIAYNATMRQMVALSELSNTCRQFLKVVFTLPFPPFNYPMFQNHI